jgi:DNA mismatch endonuclease (patch repair protein)
LDYILIKVTNMVILMADVFDKNKRSEIMKKVRSKNNKSTELKLIKIFKENDIHGWRRNYNVKGHPDFVFLDKRIAIFVDGCFWHGHECRNTKPKQNQEYWDKKRVRNMQHDIEITQYFENRGWTVIRIWECELKKDNRQTFYDKITPLFK